MTCQNKHLVCSNVHIKFRVAMPNHMYIFKLGVTRKGLNSFFKSLAASHFWSLYSDPHFFSSLSSAVGPTEVKILNVREPISAGKRYEAKCQSVGARPQPVVTWWIGGRQVRDGITYSTSPDGNVTISTLQFTPSVLDATSLLVCRAGNPGLRDSMLEDSWKLEIYCEFESWPFCHNCVLNIPVAMHLQIA